MLYLYLISFAGYVSMHTQYTEGHAFTQSTFGILHSLSDVCEVCVYTVDYL